MMRSVEEVTAELTMTCFTSRHFIVRWMNSSTAKA